MPDDEKKGTSKKVAKPSTSTVGKKGTPPKTEKKTTEKKTTAKKTPPKKAVPKKSAGKGKGDDKGDFECKETEPADAVIHHRALGKILRHGFRFCNAAIEQSKWVECMGFLLGDVDDDNMIIIKDAVPVTNGSKVEVRFTSEHYRTSDEINATLSDDLWVVGWYHTHPGHDLFLSTIDRVNHAGYQILNPNAVALVFDPSKVRPKKIDQLDHYMKLFKLVNPRKMEAADYLELENIRMEGGFADMVEAFKDLAETVEKGHPIMLEYKETTMAGLGLEEVISKTYDGLLDIKRDVKQLKQQQTKLETQVKIALKDLIDDEELE